VQRVTQQEQLQVISPGQQNPREPACATTTSGHGTTITAAAATLALVRVNAQCMAHTGQNPAAPMPWPPQKDSGYTFTTKLLSYGKYTAHQASVEAARHDHTINTEHSYPEEHPNCLAVRPYNRAAYCGCGVGSPAATVRGSTLTQSPITALPSCSDALCANGLACTYSCTDIPWTRPANTDAVLLGRLLLSQGLLSV